MKTISRVLLALLLIWGLNTGVSAKADVTQVGTDKVVAVSEGRYSLGEGEYRVEGEITDPIVTQGDVTLTLSGSKIDMSEKGAPAISVESGSLSVILEGDNVARGGISKAGVYVAPEATLAISGSENAKLSAYGGDGEKWVHGGGAGIGGNGIKATEPSAQAPDFGTVIVNSGTIHATGGKAMYSNAGAGAGIGGGGVGRYDAPTVPVVKGKVIIEGGTVVATGGEGEEKSETLGGAGIGGGGVGSGTSADYYSEIEVHIRDGKVTAVGTADGAGIGGGANLDGGIIAINGGQVEATGGREPSGTYGGAGIGGGDTAGVTSITIGGDAKVVARGSGAAAGIGGGKDGSVGVYSYATEKMTYGTIRIEGNAEVSAYGGSAKNWQNEEFGGAGIGSGTSYYVDACSSNIVIGGHAKVRAYAGARSQAIGTGALYEGSDPNTFKIESDQVDIWMFNQDDVEPAFWGQNDQGNGLTSGYSAAKGLVTAWYTNAEGAAFPTGRTEAYTSPDQGEFQWKLSGNTIQLYSDGKMIASEEAPFVPGNWGTLVKWNPVQNIAPDQLSGLPQTGDNSQIFMWIALLGCVCAVAVCRKECL